MFLWYFVFNFLIHVADMFVIYFIILDPLRFSPAGSSALMQKSQRPREQNWLSNYQWVGHMVPGKNEELNYLRDFICVHTCFKETNWAALQYVYLFHLLT